MLRRGEQSVGPRTRRWLLTALVGYCAVLAFILLWPSAGPAATVVRGTTDVLLRLGAPSGVVSGGRVEFGLNALMIAPVPLLVSLLWPAWSWERWTAYGFVGSLSIEAVQAVLLTGRSAQFRDVVSNTLGALIGALLAPAVRRWWLARDR